eukprot:sb/3472342/
MAPPYSPEMNPKSRPFLCCQSIGLTQFSLLSRENCGQSIGLTVSMTNSRRSDTGSVTLWSHVGDIDTWCDPHQVSMSPSLTAWLIWPACAHRGLYDRRVLMRARRWSIASLTATTAQEPTDTTNHKSLSRSRDWLSTNQGPVLPDSLICELSDIREKMRYREHEYEI